MIAKDRGRGLWLFSLVLAAVVIVAVYPSRAQQSTPSKFPVPPPAPTTKADPQYKVNVKDIDVPGLTQKQIPVNPGDPIATVNGQVISRQQLADECVARKGKEILEMLIHRTLIDQALRARRLEVTAAEIDQEIDTIAQRFGISREGWLRTLDKERGISPVQYARDIIYPALALRKLSSGKVQVTPADMKNAFEAQYGEKLRCRMILVDKLPTARAIWEQLRQNPGGFEKIAQEQSMDTGSRSLGGLLGEPITRHAYPQNLSDSAFQQLVDGDPADRDPSHKPKDGDFTGPIQASEMAWVILRRESVTPAVKDVSLSDPRILKQTQEMIYEVKLKEVMQAVFQELLKSAAIENQLAGTVKLANEDKDPNFGVDHDVKLMSNPAAGKGADARAAVAAGAASAAARPKIPTPAALAPDAAQQFDKLNRPLKGATGAASAQGSTAGTAPAAASARSN
jgi:parvulin-like peptidyl-prolyl isomerase